MGGNADHALAALELFRVCIRRAARLLANSVRGREARSLLCALWPCPSAPPYPAHWFTFRWGPDAFLELLRARQRHQRADHDAHSRTIHRSGCRVDDLAKDSA